MLKFVEKAKVVVIASDSNHLIKNLKTQKVHSVFEVDKDKFNASDYQEIE